MQKKDERREKTGIIVNKKEKTKNADKCIISMDLYAFSKYLSNKYFVDTQTSMFNKSATVTTTTKGRTTTTKAFKTIILLMWAHHFFCPSPRRKKLFPWNSISSERYIIHNMNIFDLFNLLAQAAVDVIFIAPVSSSSFVSLSKLIRRTQYHQFLYTQMYHLFN